MQDEPERELMGMLNDIQTKSQKSYDKVDSSENDLDSMQVLLRQEIFDVVVKTYGGMISFEKFRKIFLQRFDHNTRRLVRFLYKKKWHFHHA